MGYADPLLNADFQSAIQDAQALEANTVIIQGTPYPCILGIASFQQIFQDGKPFQNVQRLSCSVLKIAFQQPPVIGNLPVIARNISWRIFEVHITAMTYELTLESPSQ